MPLFGDLEDDILGRLLSVSGDDRGAFHFYDAIEPGNKQRSEVEDALARLKEGGMINFDEPLLGVQLNKANLRVTQAGRVQCLLNEGRILRTVIAGTSESILDVAASFQRLRDETETVDSSQWTGLTQRIGNERIAKIRENTAALILTIEQAEMPDRDRQNALSRARALDDLVQAPDPPWRIILDILNSAPLTAFLNSAAIITIIHSVF
ncbi:hypothetical protein [Tsuneonella mangrovi]|uniref:hypothetical protein n=1 Tax=Tsuneonella mangrovi TaxID=1982042 RepID=UPI000BA1F157|nr:hypothetical protein [Tsuneonella mangrovi]